MEESERASLLPTIKAIGGAGSEEPPELQSFYRGLKWMCLDQSTKCRTTLSCSVFFILVVGNPLLTHFFYVCWNCDEAHRRPYDAVVQLSLSILATISFVCISIFARKYEVRRFFFLDKLREESEMVRRGYTVQLQRSMNPLFFWVLPCFTAVCIYKIWWYVSGATQISFWGNIYISDMVACTLQLSSWLYRTTIFFFVCILFRLICHLQILRLEDFALVFQKESDAGHILLEHLRVRRNLRTISHRFRAFILLTLVFVTASQLASLLVTTRSSARVNIYKAGELALCSITLVTWLFICLRCATKITHKAQSVTSLASKWHVCSTIDSFDGMNGETPVSAKNASSQVCPIDVGWSDDEEGDGDDELDNTKMIPVYAHTVSFQKRQALVMYLENNRAGITVYGFMLDRTWLRTIFGIEMSLVLWLLSKTVGIS